MPHIPGHFQARDIEPRVNYRIYGTNQPYSGMTVEVGGHLYTTVGGALEGNSYQVFAAQQMTPDGFEGDIPPSPLPGRRPTPLPNDGIIDAVRPDIGTGPFAGLGFDDQTPGGIRPISPVDPSRRPLPNPQDVITMFKVGDNSQYGGRRSYYYSNGNRVPNGTSLHHHTIAPRGRSNFMTQHTMDGREEDVYTSRPRFRPSRPSTGNIGDVGGNDISPGGNIGGGGSGGGMSGGGMNQGGGGY